MPWVALMVLITEMKSSNLIAQEARSQAANGNKLEVCKWQDQATWHLLCQKLMIFVEQQRSQLQHQRSQLQQQQQRR